MGFITCAVVQDIERLTEPVIFRYDAYHCPLGRETKLVRALLSHLSPYQVWVGHNIKNFDYNYIKSRACILGVPMPHPPPLYYDTMEGFNHTGFKTVLTKKGRPTSRLDHVWDFFYGRDCKENPKTAIYPEESAQMLWGRGQHRKEAIDRKVDHCIRDVGQTIDVFEKVFPADPKRALKPLT